MARKEVQVESTTTQKIPTQKLGEQGAGSQYQRGKGVKLAREGGDLPSEGWGCQQAGFFYSEWGQGVISWHQVPEGR